MSYLLKEYVKTLHLRIDAPMPSEEKAAHDRIKALRSCPAPKQGAKILQFHRHPAELSVPKAA